MSQVDQKQDASKLRASDLPEITHNARLDFGDGEIITGRGHVDAREGGLEGPCEAGSNLLRLNPGSDSQI